MNMESPEQISLSIPQVSLTLPLWSSAENKVFIKRNLPCLPLPPPDASLLHYPPYLLMERLCLRPVHPTETCCIFQLHFFKCSTCQSSSFWTCTVSQFKVCLFFTQKESLFMMMHCSEVKPQGREWCGVFISHLQSVGLKLYLNFVGSDCIMGSFERTEFDWNGKQCLLALKIHHCWLDYE